MNKTIINFLNKQLKETENIYSPQKIRIIKVVVKIIRRKISKK